MPAETVPADRSIDLLGDRKRHSLEAWRAVLTASQRCQRLARELRQAEAECAERVREYRDAQSPNSQIDKPGSHNGGSK